MAKVNNPRFPHTCKVYKVIGGDAWESGTEEVLYEGKCNKYGSSNLRTFNRDNVIKADYAVDIPGLVRGVSTGCLLDVTDYTGTYEKLTLTDAYPTEMGTTLYFNMSKN